MARFYDLAGPSLWYDELASIALAEKPISQLWSSWIVRETNPPLYYSILHYWISIFGDSEFSVRVPSALIGSLIPFVIYCTARELIDGRTGLVAAAITAVSSRQIYSSEEARAYIFLCGSAAIAVIGVSRFTALNRNSQEHWSLRARAAAIYIVGCAASLYLHTTGALLPLLANMAFFVCWTLDRDRSRKTVSAWIAVNAICFALWLWWVSITIRQMATPDSNVSWMHQPSVEEAFRVTIWTLLPRSPRELAGVPGIILALVAAFGVTKVRDRSARVILVTFAVGVPFLLFGLGVITPLISQRTLLIGFFAPTILMSVGLRAIWNELFQTALIAAVVVLATAQLWSDWGGRELEPWRQLVAELSRTLGPDTAIVFSEDSIGLHLAYYCRRTPCSFRPVLIEGRTAAAERWSVDLYNGDRIRASQLPDLFAGFRQVWTIERAQSRPDIELAKVAKSQPAPIHVSLPDYMKVAAWSRASPGVLGQ